MKTSSKLQTMKAKFIKWQNKLYIQSKLLILVFQLVIESVGNILVMSFKAKLFRSMFSINQSIQSSEFRGSSS